MHVGVRCEDRDQAVLHECKIDILRSSRLFQSITPDIKYKLLTALTGIALVSFLAAHNLHDAICKPLQHEVLNHRDF